MLLLIRMLEKDCLVRITSKRLLTELENLPNPIIRIIQSFNFINCFK